MATVLLGALHGDSADHSDSAMVGSVAAFRRLGQLLSRYQLRRIDTRRMRHRASDPGHARATAVGDPRIVLHHNDSCIRMIASMQLDCCIPIG